MIITTQDYINMALLVFIYGLVNFALLGFSAWVVNHFWVDPISNTSNVNQVGHITTEPKHYRQSA